MNDVVRMRRYGFLTANCQGPFLVGLLNGGRLRSTVPLLSYDQAAGIAAAANGITYQIEDFYDPQHALKALADLWIVPDTTVIRVVNPADVDAVIAANGNAPFQLSGPENVAARAAEIRRLGDELREVMRGIRDLSGPYAVDVARDAGLPWHYFAMLLNGEDNEHMTVEGAESALEAAFAALAATEARP